MAATSYASAIHTPSPKNIVYILTHNRNHARETFWKAESDFHRAKVTLSKIKICSDDHYKWEDAACDLNIARAAVIYSTKELERAEKRLQNAQHRYHMWASGNPRWLEGTSIDKLLYGPVWIPSDNDFC